jgi:hypothetical protein
VPPWGLLAPSALRLVLPLRVQQGPRMSLLQIAGEPYPRFICDVCHRQSGPDPNDELLAAGWRETRFQTYMCALCMRMGSDDRPQTSVN